MAMSPSLRAHIRQRDNDTCQRCGATGENVKRQIHHIIPSLEGGQDTPSNLVLLCEVCHGRVHEEGPSEFLKEGDPSFYGTSKKPSYSTADAARILGVSRTAVYGRIASGRLTLILDAAGKRRVTAESVESHLQGSSPYAERSNAVALLNEVEGVKASGPVNSGGSTYAMIDAARYLDISIQTVYRWLREGRLVEARDAAGKRRVTAASVEARPQKRSPYERSE